MRRGGLGSVLLGLGAALAVVLGFETPLGQPLWPWLEQRLTYHAFYAEHSLAGGVFWHALRRFATEVHGLYPVLLVVGCLGALGGIVTRAVAAAGMRGGKPDPLESLRARRKLLRAVTALPAGLVLLAGAADLLGDIREVLWQGALQDSYFVRETLATPLAVAAIAAFFYVATRAGVRAFLAPLRTETAPPKDAGEIVFSAVAVTARTRAVVGGLAAVTVAMIALGLFAPDGSFFPWALDAYVAIALVAPFALRRASRIAVGLDGVWVRDASRELFFAFASLDEARTRGADLELMKAGRPVLRLQMHGEDAARRDEVLARVNAGVERARGDANPGAAMMLQALPRRRVVASSLGAESYRVPSVSREQLWDLVEAASTDPETRAAAAEALAARLDGSERERLRLAAAQCASPRVRVTLGALTGDDADEGEPSSGRAVLPPAARIPSR